MHMHMHMHMYMCMHMCMHMYMLCLKCESLHVLTAKRGDTQRLSDLRAAEIDKIYLILSILSYLSYLIYLILAAGSWLAPVCRIPFFHRNPSNTLD